VSDIIDAIIMNRTVDVPSSLEQQMNISQAHVLVVDDNRMNCDLLVRFLSSEGCLTTAAFNGREAMDLLRRQSFDLVLLDIMMPKMNGYQVLEAMRRDPDLMHLPVIMISAVDEMESVIRCIELGAEDYLFKPVKGALLKARVNASLDKKRLRDEDRAQKEDLNRLNRAAKELNATFNVRRILQTTLEHAMRWAGAQAGVVGVVDERQLDSVLVVSAGQAPVEAPASTVVDWEKVQGLLNTSTAQIVALPATQVTVTDSTSGSGTEATQGQQRWLVVPLRREDGALGVMLLLLAEAQDKAEPSTELLMRLADHAAIALWNASLYHSAIADTEAQRAQFGTQLASISLELKLASAMIKEYTSLLKADSADVKASDKAAALESIRTKASHVFSLTTDLDDEARKRSTTEPGQGGQGDQASQGDHKPQGDSHNSEGTNTLNTSIIL
jgi:DNA-binding response OmpR family regulator